MNTSNKQTIGIILSSIAPFLCTYYRVASVILEKVSLRTCFNFDCNFSCKFQLLNKPFGDKDAFVAVQKQVEHLMLTENINHVHPYCLSLDSINMAILSLCNFGGLLKEKK